MLPSKSMHYTGELAVDASCSYPIRILCEFDTPRKSISVFARVKRMKQTPREERPCSFLRHEDLETWIFPTEFHLLDARGPLLTARGYAVAS